MYTPDSNYEETQIGNDGYYRLNNEYVENYDENIISNIIANEVNSGSHIIEFKTNSALYDSIKYQLLDQERIFDIFESIGIPLTNINYMEIPSLGFIEFYY